MSGCPFVVRGGVQPLGAKAFAAASTSLTAGSFCTSVGLLWFPWAGILFGNSRDTAAENNTIAHHNETRFFMEQFFASQKIRTDLRTESSMLAGPQCRRQTCLLF